MKIIIAVVVLALSIVGCERTRVVYISPETGKEVPPPTPAPKPPKKMTREFPGFKAYTLCSPDGTQYVIGEGNSGGVYMSPRVSVDDDGNLKGFRCDRNTNAIVYRDRT